MYQNCCKIQASNEYVVLFWHYIHWSKRFLSFSGVDKYIEPLTSALCCADIVASFSAAWLLWWANDVVRVSTLADSRSDLASADSAACWVSSNRTSLLALAFSDTVKLSCSSPIWAVWDSRSCLEASEATFNSSISLQSSFCHQSVWIQQHRHKLLYDWKVFKQKDVSSFILQWMQKTIVNNLYSAISTRERCLKRNLCMEHRTLFGKATCLWSL